MLRLLDCFDDILIEPFMPNGSIIAFDISILLRLARLDMLDRDVAALGPFQKLATDVFRAVVDPNACRLALACRAFGVSQTCYRYSPKLKPESERIEDLLIGLTKAHKTWGFGLCFLHLRNVKGHLWNHKRVYRIYRELELNLRIKPRKRLVREKPYELIPNPSDQYPCAQSLSPMDIILQG